MTDLRARILERADQLERLARSASAYGEHWAPDCQDVDGEHIDRVVGDGDEEDPTVIYADGRAISHIATWDPAAVLALCAGARQLLDWTNRRPLDDYTPDGAYALTEEQPVVLGHLARMLGLGPDGDANA